MFRFLIRPKWIALTITVVLLVVLMLNLSAWQFRRLDEKKAFNDAVTTRTDLPVAAIDDVLTPSSMPNSVEWRRVSVTGTYLADKAVRIVNRSQDSTAGLNTAVPLQLDDGRVVFVNRGFVPLTIDVPLPAAGTVTVVGYLRASQSRSSVGVADVSGDDVRDFQRFDIPRLSQIVDATVLPMYVQRINESPTQTTQWPATVAFPTLDNGPHFSYAIQWIFFSLCAIAGWLVAVRREIQQSAMRSSS